MNLPVVIICVVALVLEVYVLVDIILYERKLRKEHQEFVHSLVTNFQKNAEIPLKMLNEFAIKKER